ncbi:hypothetical protein NC652_032099 [Populus alba x Populus x berolinensis]|nr:hypothetical protein NC652_032099 [Populus alba x Populus x berolinensis]
MARDLSSIAPLLSKISQVWFHSHSVILLSGSVQNLSALLMLAVSKLLARDITNFLQAVATLIDFYLGLLRVSHLN